MYDFGPQAQRVYDTLRERMRSGASPAGMPLPSHRHLAIEFGVAPLTVRHALARLENENFVQRIQGRGTFVRSHTVPAIVIVEDDLAMRTLLGAHVERLGYRPITTATTTDALSALENDDSVALILSDVRVPDATAGVTFIRSVHHRWPHIPLAAVTGHPDDLVELHGTPECPILILSKPIWAHQIEEVVRLTMRTPLASSPPMEVLL